MGGTLTDFVSPAAEASSRVDILGLQLGQEVLQDALTLEGGGRVAVVKAAVVGGDDLVGGLDHPGVDQTLDGVSEDVGLVDRLHGRLGDLQHDGPVRALLGLAGRGPAAVAEGLRGKLHGLIGLVVGGVVGEDRGSVERAVIFGEVELRHVSNGVLGGPGINVPSTCLRCSLGVLRGFPPR